MTRLTSTTPAASASSSTSRGASRTHRPGRDPGPPQPRASRRVRLREEHRRRRRHPDADAPPVLRRGGGPPGHQAARRRPVRRRRPSSCRQMREPRRVRASMEEVDPAPRARSSSAGATVPTDNSMLGPTAKASQPVMRQVFIGREGRGSRHRPDDLAFERKLYVIRRVGAATSASRTCRGGPTSTSAACRRGPWSTRAC